MTLRKSGPEKRADELLELWMGEAADAPAPRRRISTPALVVGAILAGTVVIVLAKFAADVLLIGLALLGIGLVLHVLGTWLAESDLLSPGWFTIVVLAAALGGWALFYPAEGLEGLGRYVPKPVAKFFEWSESRGWGQRVLIGPGTGGSASRTGSAPTSPPASPPSTPVEAARPAIASGPALSLTASATTLRAGQPVTLTAQLPGDSSATVIVVFYDGLVPLGQAQLLSKGRSRSASLTITLAGGQHQVTAAAGLMGLRSKPVQIIVAR